MDEEGHVREVEECVRHVEASHVGEVEECEHHKDLHDHELSVLASIKVQKPNVLELKKLLT